MRTPAQVGCCASVRATLEDAMWQAAWALRLSESFKVAHSNEEYAAGMRPIGLLPVARTPACGAMQKRNIFLAEIGA